MMITTSQEQTNDGPTDQPANDGQSSPPADQLSLLELPAEIIQDIASYLSAPDLARLGATCRALVDHASNDLLWANLVNERLPTPIRDPARYDNRCGVIEAYRVVAGRGTPQFQLWTSHPEVMIQSFEPSVRLALDDPVLFLNDPNPTSQTAPNQSFQSMPEERRMPMASDSPLSLCSESSTPGPWVEPDAIWPPRTIPSNTRTVRDLRDSPPPRPKRLWELSESFFRIRKWLDPGFMFLAERPYQGIWVGDYSAHGCEFLLVLQKGMEAEAHSDEKKSKITDAQEDIGQRGSLQAVKLTGDPNCRDEEEPFVGARIVRCRGHVAGLGFRDDTYIDSQLILISPDHMAHYWKEMGHVSYFRRVDIDALLHSS
ncbi:hypothetical protein N7519_002129 [Penicillium mononematosum]|uniref:uncharacterized protein n=1 Tax=Penicillium mononematosum TaxID=268346 RepID=UPI002546B39B|nr:uncharacterized protein N7519_002129 [Penicillium mononematosum]KAJ6187221.1 hypothetical protein N7519_002129 [Penicillium mononematosum]